MRILAAPGIIPFNRSSRWVRAVRSERESGRDRKAIFCFFRRRKPILFLRRSPKNGDSWAAFFSWRCMRYFFCACWQSGVRQRIISENFSSLVLQRLFFRRCLFTSAQIQAFFQLLE